MRSNPDTIKTGKYHRRYPGRGGQFSGSAENKNEIVRRAIGGEGRTVGYLDKLVKTVKGA